MPKMVGLSFWATRLHVMKKKWKKGRLLEFQTFQMDSEFFWFFDQCFAKQVQKKFYIGSISKE